MLGNNDVGSLAVIFEFLVVPSIKLIIKRFSWKNEKSVESQECII